MTGGGEGDIRDTCRGDPKPTDQSRNHETPIPFHDPTRGRCQDGNWLPSQGEGWTLTSGLVCCLAVLVDRAGLHTKGRWCFCPPPPRPFLSLDTLPLLGVTCRALMTICSRWAFKLLQQQQQLLPSSATCRDSRPLI